MFSRILIPLSFKGNLKTILSENLFLCNCKGLLLTIHFRMMSKIFLLVVLIACWAQAQSAAVDDVETAWKEHKVGLHYSKMLLTTT